MPAPKCQYCKRTEAEGSEFDRHEVLIRHGAGIRSHPSCKVRALRDKAASRAWIDNLPVDELGCCPRTVLGWVFTESEVKDRIARVLAFINPRRG